MGRRRVKISGPSKSGDVVDEESKLAATAHGLSAIQAKILRMVADGRTGVEMARGTGMSTGAVASQLVQIRVAMAVTSTSAAVAIAQATGLLG